MTRIYLADTDRLADPGIFEDRYRTLPAHRKEKVDGMCLEKNKRLCMGAWLLLVHALKEAGIGDQDIRLSYGPSGKPYLTDHPGVFFNLSHSGSRVLCAVSDREVGCDVQKITSADLRLAERYFCPEECQTIVAAPAGERDVLFCRFWTLKESFVKNIGRGLSLPLREFCIRLTEDGPAVVQQALPSESFYLKEFDLQDGYRYACCARQGEISDAVMVQLA